MFTSIVEELQVLIAEKMDYRSQLEFTLSSKHGKDVVALTRYKPVIEASALNMIVSMGMLSISVKLKANKGVQLFSGFSVNPLNSSLSRFKVSEVVLGGVIEPTHITTLRRSAEFCNNEVELKLFGTSVKYEIFLKLAEVFHFTSMVNDMPYGDGPCNDLQNAFFDFLPIFEFKRLHFAPADFSKFHMLPELKATEIVIRQNWWVKEMPRITPTLNVFFKQWFRYEREIDWLRIAMRNSNPEDSAEILFFELSPSYVWRKNGGQNDYLQLLKKMDYYGNTHKLVRGDVVYTLDRGDKKLLVLVKHFKEIIAQEFTDLNDVLIISAT